MEPANSYSVCSVETGPRHAALLQTSKIGLLIPPYSTGKIEELDRALDPLEVSVDEHNVHLVVT